MKHELPKLDYKYNDLEPHIDAMTMELHHTKHHQTYVDKLNAALEGFTDLQEKDVETLLKEISHVPDSIKQAVINHGGGHANHTLFWKLMSSNGGKPSGDVLKAIEKRFGSFDKFKSEFETKALGLFGSGWTWLVLNSQKELEIVTTPNQNSPLMDGKKPLIGLDMWEHSFYKKFGPNKKSYVEAFFNVLNWNYINELYNSN
jgi:superoxide dismutase, Fe-Mn family